MGILNIKVCTVWPDWGMANTSSLTGRGFHRGD